MDDRRVNHWGPGLLAVALAVAAHHLSVLGVFFLVPLAWVRIRYDERSFWGASVLAAVGIVASEMAFRALAKAPWTSLDTVMLGFPISLIAGWVAIVAMERLGWRFLYRLLAVTAALGLVGFAQVVAVLKSPAFVELLNMLYESVWKSAIAAQGLVVEGGVGDKAWFLETLKVLFLGSSLFLMFLILGLTGRMARSFSDRSKPVSGGARDFYLPSSLSLTFLALTGVALAVGLTAKAGAAPWNEAVVYGALNSLLVLVALHLWTGLGIAQVWFDRFVPAGRRVLVSVLIWASMIFVPGVLPLTIFTLVVLAVLELWVNFRNRTQGVGL